MFLKEFNQTGVQKVSKINKFLKEEFGMSVAYTFPKKEKLIKVKETSELALIKLKGSDRHFHLHPEYAKYLGIRDLADTMLNEGMYAESPAYMEMKDQLMASVQQLMDSGYTVDEASKECMNRYRQDSRFAYDDEHVLPIVLKAAKDYFESSCSTRESVEEEIVEAPETDLNEFLLRELAKEVGVELADSESLNAIEEKLEMFAKVTGKSRDAVVGFLNGLEEEKLETGIKFFGAKVAEANAFVDARRKAIQAGDDEFEVDGKTFKVTGDTEDEKKNESMFDDIIDDMLNEELEGTSVEEAEVVMAVRALADDIQDQVERLGRMVNEDIPAIADQMIHEFGAQRAQQFKDSADQVLQAALEGAKQGKEGINALVGEITGEPMASGEMGLGDTGDIMAEPVAGDELDDMGGADPAVDINEPAAAGPEEEPLGRAPVEV